MTATSQDALQPQAPPLRAPAPAPEELAGLTWRALLLGAAFAVLLNVANPAAEWRYSRFNLSYGFLPMAVMLPFLFCVAILNPLLKLLSPRFALRPGELMIIFAMGLVGITIPRFMVGFVMAYISSLDYFATPENEWATYLRPYVEPWLTPTNANKEITWFYEGLPPWATIPWGAWLVPLFWWFSLIGTFYFMSFCLVVIFRRQWVENERLIFPLMELPREMVRESGNPRKLPAFMSSKLFWTGFAIAGFTEFANWLHSFVPIFPEIRLYVSLGLGKTFGTLWLWLWFPVLGIAYLANLDVLASVWVFRLLHVLQSGIFNRIGFSIGSTGPWVKSDPPSAWQSTGAFFFMVAFTIWIARKHLGRVVRKAFGGEPDLDDTREPMSYRTAVWGLLLGLVFFCAWLSRAGMEAHVIAVVVPAVSVIYLGMTRIVAQIGLWTLTPPMLGEEFTMLTVGTENMSHKSLVTLGLQYVWHGNVQCFFMAAAANVMKLTDRIRGAMRAMPLAILITVVLGFVTATVYILFIGYDQGAYNLGSWEMGIGAAIFRIGGDYIFGDLMGRIKALQGPDSTVIILFSMGATEMGILTFLRYRYTWWPLHPIGLATASGWHTGFLLFNVFLAWLIKLIVLRIGGLRLYESSKPFFYGLVLGFFFGNGTFPLIVDTLLFGKFQR